MRAESLLRFGSEEAVTIARRIEKSERKKQVALLSDLWANAKGITIVKSLAILIDLHPKRAEYYYALNSDAMDDAEDTGYSFKVSEALYNALAVTDSSSDHYHLLDALLYRMEQKNKKRKGTNKCSLTWTPVRKTSVVVDRIWLPVHPIPFHGCGILGD